MTIIKNLLEAGKGVQYIKDSTGEARISCMFQQIIVEDLKTGMGYWKNVDEHTTYPEFRKIVRDNNITTLAELYEHMAFKERNISFEEFNPKKEFNPFFNELTGELKIKTKNGIFTKTQVKKILQHKDTKIIIKNSSSDDYLYDLEHSKKEADRLEVLDQVYRCFDAATNFENGSFGLFVAGMSVLYEVTNKNIKVA